MKNQAKKILIGVFAVAALAAVAAFAFPAMKTAALEDTTVEPTDAAINWISWDEAIKANQKKPKKIFVDVYTDWCGWCKQMDKTTFSDPKVVEIVNKNFYAVKFDAEGKDNVVYDGHTFKFMASGARGVHELAYALLDGSLGYPSYVYLNEARERITISPGYKPTDSFLKELQFILEEHYKTMSYKDFMSK